MFRCYSYTIIRERINSSLLKLLLLKQYFDVDVVWFQLILRILLNLIAAFVVSYCSLVFLYLLYKIACLASIIFHIRTVYLDIIKVLFIHQLMH